MALSKRSQHILDLWQAFNQSGKLEQAESLKIALLELIDTQLHDETLLADAKLAHLNKPQLKAEMLALLGGDVLCLCDELSQEKSARDEVNSYLKAAVGVSANERLIRLLRTYRTFGFAKQDANALYEEIHPIMMRMARNFFRNYMEQDDYANEAVNMVVEKWLKQGGLLHDWQEGRGASITTWIYSALKYVAKDIKRELALHNEHLVANGNLDDDNDDIFGRLPDRIKSQSSLIRTQQLEIRVDNLIADLPGQRICIDGKKVTLTDTHARIMAQLIKQPELTDQQRAEHFEMAYSTFKRHLHQVYAFIRNHPAKDELVLLLQPCTPPFVNSY